MLVWQVLLFVVGRASGSSSVEDLFDAWLERSHRRTVGGPASGGREQAKVTFAANARLVAALNEDAAGEGGGALFELNEFADLTPEDFARLRLMPRRSASAGSLFVAGAQNKKSYERKEDAVNVTAFDWRDKGAVTPVRDQGNLGTCWAFATAENVEGQRFLHGDGALEPLSVEQLLECSGDHDDEAKHSDCGEFGGWPYLGFEYLLRAGGLRTEREMPYCAAIPYDAPGNCLPCMPGGYSKRLCGAYSKDDDFDDDLIPLFCEPNTTLGQGPAGFCHRAGGVAIDGWAGIGPDDAAIVDALVHVGPLTVVINALKLQFYKGGVYAPRVCDRDRLDHAVLLVGFGRDFGGRDYWIVKNSWGTSWGEDGYFRIARENGTCGLNTNVATSVIRKRGGR